MSDQPNLFKFAPRELSHSAFWAWVLDTLNSEDEDLRDVQALGRSLLRSVGASPPTESIEVESEYVLPEGAGRVDIYAKIDGREALLIENKVSARPSVEQLRSYQQSPDAEEAHFLLISTTYPTQNAAKVEEEPWAFLRAEDVKGLLGNVERQHPVITDYYDWISGIVDNRAALERRARSSSEEQRTKALKTIPGQWAFMREVIAPFAETGRLYAHRGRSGGHAWTQFRFIESEKTQDEVFYRVEKLASGPTFRVNQYQMTPTPDLASKQARLEKLRELWFNTVDNVGELAWDQKNTGGRQRCEIARLDLREYGVEEVSAEIENVHGVFVGKLKKYGWDVERTAPLSEV